MFLVVLVVRIVSADFSCRGIFCCREAGEGLSRGVAMAVARAVGGAVFRAYGPSGGLVFRVFSLPKGQKCPSGGGVFGVFSLPEG
jgi:hypothetical protein